MEYGLEDTRTSNGQVTAIVQARDANGLGLSDSRDMAMGKGGEESEGKRALSSKPVIIPATCAALSMPDFPEMCSAEHYSRGNENKCNKKNIL